MVQTIINGVVYDYYEPESTAGSGGDHTVIHENTDADLTSLEGRVLQNETVLGNATNTNTSDTLVKRQALTYFQDVVSQNLDTEQVIEILADNGYFYWENPGRNQFIQIGSSIQAEDPALANSGFTHYHQNTATTEITGNVDAAPLRITANVDTITNMFEIVNTVGEITFAVTRNGDFVNETITNLLNTVANLESRIHILENNAGL